MDISQSSTTGESPGGAPDDVTFLGTKNCADGPFDFSIKCHGWESTVDG